MLSTPVGRLRLFSLLEALTYLFLLGVAVPMQIGGNDKLVAPAGMTHGVMFVLYVLTTLDLRSKLGWNHQLTLKVLAAAVIPFAPFWVERWLRTQSVAART